MLAISDLNSVDANWSPEEPPLKFGMALAMQYDFFMKLTSTQFIKQKMPEGFAIGVINGCDDKVAQEICVRVVKINYVITLR